MDDNPRSGGRPDVEFVAEQSEKFLRRGAKEVRIRATEKEVDVLVKRPLISSVWTTAWTAAKKLFGGFLK